MSRKLASDGGASNSGTILWPEGWSGNFGSTRTKGEHDWARKFTFLSWLYLNTRRIWMQCQRSSLILDYDKVTSWIHHGHYPMEVQRTDLFKSPGVQGLISSTDLNAAGAPCA